MTPEGKVKKAIKAMFHKYKVYYVMPAPGIFGAKVGTADFIACVCGYFMAIEVKGPNGAETKIQAERRQEVLTSGGMAFVVTPDRLPALERTIRTIITASMQAMQKAVQPEQQPTMQSQPPEVANQIKEAATAEPPSPATHCEHGKSFDERCYQCEDDERKDLADDARSSM